MDWKLWAPFSAFIILLICSQCSCNWKVQLNKGKNAKGQILWEDFHYNKRQKREWIAPPANIKEQEDNRYRNPIAKVHSDMEVKKGIIRYQVSGQGVDQPPYGLFIIDPKTGYLNVSSVMVDREEVSMLYLMVHAFSATGLEVENPLMMRVKVLDINDNAPVFSQSVFAGAVEENSKANTLVMQIMATDADEENTVNSQIAYRIISQNPSDPPMFIMNQYTGQVFTMSNLLDREMTSSYSIIVSGKDLNGAEGGLSGQCGADIKILDVNDNFPMPEYDSYTFQIKENWVGITSLRMSVFDLDEMYSDNWIAYFDIISGNEGGWFAIETDPQTNQGVLRVVKALDYETMQSANLAFLVVNKAPFHYSVMSEYRATVTKLNVAVQNVREGPVFIPAIHHVNIPEGLSSEDLLQYVVAQMVAVDSDTGKPAINVVYSVTEESSRWFIIDSTTGELRLTQEMVRDGANNAGRNITATILAEDTTDPTLTSTATVSVGMISPNPDQACPAVTTEPRISCLQRTEVIIRAFQDPPNPPYKITIGPNSEWTVVPLNDTAVTVIGNSNLGVRNHTVLVYVTDRNNISCPNPFPFIIQTCDCGTTGFCDLSKQVGKSVSLGPAAIGLMVLGFLVLLLALLLLPLCVCGAGAGAKFVPVAAGYDGACHEWGTEGAKPEDVDMRSPFITSGAPDYSEVNASNTMHGVGAVAGSTSGTGMRGIRDASATGIETMTALGEGMAFGGTGIGGYSGESNIANSYMGTMPPAYEKSGTLNMAYVENYFAEKAESYANEDESRAANDCLLIYDNEGIGSPAGSVGCCSFIADDLDDTFLDTLGPKFKTLAEICIGSEIEPVLSGEEPRLFPNVPIIETETNVILDDSTINVPVNRSAPISSSTYVTESAISSANLQPVRPMPETLIPGNVVVTETYTTSGGTLRPVTRNVDPGRSTNILVTERMVGSAAAPGHGVFPDLHSGSNVIVTERVVRPSSDVHEFIELPNLANPSNVVLRERVLTPHSSRMSNSFNIPDLDLGDGQNVLVTERVIQPISNVQGNLSIRPEMGSSQNIYVTEKTVRSGPAIKTQMLSAEPLLTQTVGSTSPSLTRSKVTKYSTVQYTKQ